MISDTVLNQSEVAASIDYFDTVYLAYQRAEAVCDSHAVRVREASRTETSACAERLCQRVTIHYYRIANFTVCLRFAGSALVAVLTRAIAHLAIPATLEPDLTICLTDSRSTGIAKPAVAWNGNQYQRRGEVRGFVNNRIFTAKQWESDALVIVDLERNLALYWVENVDRIPYWEMGAPLQSIFNAWLSQRQLQLVHGAFVGVETGGVLLVGKGGSGKSTTALSCLNSDLMYGSDDYCLITPEPVPTAFSLYSTGKKNADDLDRLPFLKSLISNPDKLDREKAVYFIQSQFPEKILRSCPLKAILIPQVTGKLATTLTETSVQIGITALLPSTIMQIAGAGKLACDLINKTLSQLPCYYLNVGTDMPQIAQTIQRFLQER
jgi:hypothetical protein